MKTRKLVRGVGINDTDYVTQRKETIGYVNGKQKRKLIWACPFYKTWTNMLRRCYATKTQNNHPTYKGCSVAEEWKTFSNFRAWMVTQDFEGNQLDKDLLFEGNRVYGPETCVFVSPMVNSFTVDSGASRGEFLIGVYWNKGKSKFMSQCQNPFTKKKEYLGYFDCEQEAHNAWLKRKLELAHELSAIQEDSRVAEALINRYSNYNPEAFNMSLNDILKEDSKWYKEFNSMEIYGECDSGCGNKATRWFGNTSAATCGSLKCIEIQNDEYEANEVNEAND